VRYFLWYGTCWYFVTDTKAGLSGKESDKNATGPRPQKTAAPNGSTAGDYAACSRQAKKGEPARGVRETLPTAYPLAADVSPGRPDQVTNSESATLAVYLGGSLAVNSRAFVSSAGITTGRSAMPLKPFSAGRRSPTPAFPALWPRGYREKTASPDSPRSRPTPRGAR
jgi:hypothetical protein